MKTTIRPTFTGTYATRENAIFAKAENAIKAAKKAYEAAKRVAVNTRIAELNTLEKEWAAKK